MFTEYLRKMFYNTTLTPQDKAPQSETYEPSHGAQSSFSATDLVKSGFVFLSTVGLTYLFKSFQLPLVSAGKVSEISLPKDKHADTADKFWLVDSSDGHFELWKNPGYPISIISEQQLHDHEVRFLSSNGSEEPTYALQPIIKIADGNFLSAWKQSEVEGSGIVTDSTYLQTFKLSGEALGEKILFNYSLGPVVSQTVDEKTIILVGKIKSLEVEEKAPYYQSRYYIVLSDTSGYSRKSLKYKDKDPVYPYLPVVEIVEPELWEESCDGYKVYCKPVEIEITEIQVTHISPKNPLISNSTSLLFTLSYPLKIEPITQIHPGTGGFSVMFYDTKDALQTLEFGKDAHIYTKHLGCLPMYHIMDQQHSSDVIKITTSTVSLYMRDGKLYRDPKHPEAYGSDACSQKSTSTKSSLFGKQPVLELSASGISRGMVIPRGEDLDPRLERKMFQPLTQPVDEGTLSRLKGMTFFDLEKRTLKKLTSEGKFEEVSQDPAGTITREGTILYMDYGKNCLKVRTTRGIEEICEGEKGIIEKQQPPQIDEGLDIGSLKR